MFDHENDENDFTIVDANGDGSLTVEEVFTTFMNEISSERIATCR